MSIVLDNRSKLGRGWRGRAFAALGALALASTTAPGCAGDADGGGAPAAPDAAPVASATSALTQAGSPLVLTLGPAELVAPPRSPRTLQARLARADGTTSASGTQLWADAPAGIAVSADGGGAEGVSNLHVLVDAQVADGDYQVPVHGVQDGEQADAVLVLHVRRAGALAVTVDPTLVPERELPAYPDGAPRPVARVADASGHGVDFVASELIVSTDDPAALDAFVARTHGQVVKSSANPNVHIAGLPTSYLVRVDGANADTTQLVADLQALDPRPGGQHRFSSAQGEGLVALGAQEARGGLSVGINWLPTAQGVLERSLADGPAGWWRPGVPLAGYTPNAFDWPAFSKGTTPSGAVSVQNIGVAEAWRALALADKLVPASVKVAIVDAGFLNYDLPHFVGFSADPFFGDFGTPNPGKCGKSECPFHGTEVAQTGFGVAGNGLNAAGPGGPVGDLLLIHNTYDYFTNMVTLPLAASLGARVINMSFSARVPATLSWSVLPFDAVTAAVHASGVLLLGAAGNDGEDVDAEDCFGICWEEAWHTPCENAGVECIGGLGWNSKMRDPGSNYGESVRMYGPFQTLRGFTPDASFPYAYPDAARGAGTSFSTPFVAGVASLVMAADPSLGASAVWDRIVATQNYSPDSSVPGYVNAYAAVRSALGPVAPYVRITGPAAGTVIGYGGLGGLGFSATADDVEDGPDCCTFRWTSNVDGLMGTGASLSFSFPSPGTRTVTVTATDHSGMSRSASVVVYAINQAPTASIVTPSNYASVYRGVPVAFQGKALDPNQLTLPCTSLSWSTSGSAGTLGGSGCTPSLSFGANGWQQVTLHAVDAYGSASDAAIWVQVVDPPGGAPIPTITSPGPGGGLWGNKSNLLVSTAVDPDGDTALTYRWSVIDRGVTTPLPYGTMRLFFWTPRETIPMSCGGRDVVLKLEVSDPAGHVGTTTRTTFVNFPPC